MSRTGDTSNPFPPPPITRSCGFRAPLIDAFLPVLCYPVDMIRYKELPENIDENIDRLTEVFLHDPNVVFAYLFGGLLKDKRSPLSDVDLALYVDRTQHFDYVSMFGKIGDILKTDEIDLVVLNHAPLSLSGRILKDRKILVDKDPFRRHRFESVILRESFDFAIKERDILHRRYGIG
jgi:uncharacterized protein